MNISDPRRKLPFISVLKVDPIMIFDKKNLNCWGAKVDVEQVLNDVSKKVQSNLKNDFLGSE